MSSGIWDDGKALLKPYSIQGNWNASTNIPNLTTVTQEGYAWIVSAAGSTNLGGITDWLVNDIAIKTVSGWAKSRPGATNWGAIEGTLSDQTDLQNAFNLKASTASVALKQDKPIAATQGNIATFDANRDSEDSGKKFVISVDSPGLDTNIPTEKAVRTELDTKLDKNVAITGATKTKITYDVDGLVTGGADATKADIGLGNVDNTSDANKPVSTAQQTALNLKADLTYVDTVSGYNSSGPIENPVYQDNGNGTITVQDIDCLFFKDDVFGTGLFKYTVPGDTFSLTDGIESYIVADYNNGSPVLELTTDRSSINGSSNFSIIVCWRQGLTIHTIDVDSFGLGLSNKLHRMIINTSPYSRYQNEGLLISESSDPNPRTVLISSAIVYASGLPVNVLAFDSSVDIFTLAYSTNGTWAYTNQLVYDNTQYNPSTGLTALSNNKYGVRWFYRSIGDVKQTFYVLGTDQYTTYAEAEKSLPPSIPVFLKNHCILVGRSIIQKSSISGIMESTFGISFSGTSVISHNDTTNRDMAGNHAKLVPSTDSITAIQFTKANGTTALYNLDSTNNNQKFGDIAGGNTTEIESDGTIKFNGNATIFDDISLSGLSFSGGGASAPDIIDFVDSNLSVYGFDGLATTERLYISSEMKHSYKEGSDIEVHVHWAPTTNGTGNVKWQLYYSWQKKDGAYTTPTLLSAVSAARGTAWQNTYISLGTISGVGMTMNSQIVFHLFRDPSDVQDTYSSDAAFIALGIHFEKDMVGSHQQLVK